MGYLLLGICAVTGGAFIVAAPLAGLIVRNRRRIERLERHIGRLERRQQAHGVVIRHLAEENVEPDEPDPPQTRPALRVIKGGAAGVGLLAFLRVHPARAAIATGGVATAAALAVTLAVSQPPGVGARDGAPPSAAMSAPIPTIPLGAGTPRAPGTAPPITPPPGATMPTATIPIVTVSAISVAVDVPAPPAVTAAPTRPSRPPPTTTPSSAAPTPSATGAGPTATSSATPAPTLGPARPCAITIAFPPLLRLCLL